VSIAVFKTIPYEHQYKTVDCSWNLPAYGLFWEMGTGKSKTALDTAAYLFRAGKIARLMILAPKGVYSNWFLREIPAHLSVDHVVVKWQANHTGLWLAEWAALDQAKNVGRLKVFVQNIEALSTERGEDFAKAFCSGGQVLCVVDESTTIKSPKAARTKAAIRVGELCQYRRILTGTPTPRDPLDLWSQFRFLSGRGYHLLGQPTWMSFRNRYANLKEVRLGGRAPFKIVLGWRYKEELAQKLAEHSSRIRKEECLDLPPKIYQVREVEPTEEQVRVYREMSEDFMTTLDDTRIDASIVLTKMQKLQQVMSGFMIDADEVVHELPHRRLDALVEAIEEIDPSESVVIWANYRAAIQRIFDRLREAFPTDGAVTYYGDTSEKDRDTAVETFQQGKRRFFIANPATGGYGLTLTRASHVIYYSRGYDWAQRSQSEDRCHRIGQQSHKVVYLDLICPDSIEVEILEILRNKMTLTASLLREKAQDWVSPLARRSGKLWKRSSVGSNTASTQPP
jgi:hypothetical protein